MEFSCLPGDMVRSIAQWLPIGDVESLFMTNRTIHREVHDHMDFWRLKYLKDYGDPHVLDDLNGYDWRGKYRFRHGMDRVKWFGRAVHRVDRTVRAKQIEYAHDDNIAIINPRNTIDVIGSNADEYHYDVEVTKILMSRHLGGQESVIYALTTDHRILRGELRKPLVDVGLPDALEICIKPSSPRRREAIIMIDTDHNLIMVKDEMHGVPLNLKVKAYSGCCAMSAIIDLDDNVWCTDNDVDIADPGWIQIPNIKGKSIDVAPGLVITDLNDNLWGFGCNIFGNLGIGNIEYVLTPVELGITGRAVYMNTFITVVVDMEYNIWLMGNTTRFVQTIKGLFGMDVTGWANINVPLRIPNYKGNGVQIGTLDAYLIGNHY